MTSDVAALEAA